MKKQAWLAAFAVPLACSCTPASAYSSLFAFGDSLSDAGNLFLEDQGKAPVSPYVGGHFSNGPTWVEDLSGMLGLGPMTPFLGPENGDNFAFGGAQTGSTEINPPNPSSPIHIDFPDQINAYDLLNPVPVKDALYTVDIGANDIMNALAAYAGGQIKLPEVDKVVTEAESNTINAVIALFGLGARALLFYEVPNLGLTPRFEGTAFQSLASSLAESFNLAVLDGLTQRESQGLKGLKVFTLDTYDLLGQITANPLQYGFSDVTDPCWTGNFTDPMSGTLCSPNQTGQDEFLFWDEVHPTAAGHLLAAEFAFDALTAVPEPSTWAMMLIGFVGLGFAGYRKTRKPVSFTA